MSKKIAFIICANDDLLLDECITYLNTLSVPEGFEIDLFTITDAMSMTSGYNEAMNASDADIKIYMHQDVFIINKHFLQDIVSIFETDDKIGVIGLVGYKNVPISGVMWDEKRYGCVPMYGISDAYKNFFVDKYRYSLSDGIEDVAVCDGCMIITSKDLLWDEGNFDAWDFYDADQCMNFLLHGYRVVVPVQKYPWFVHDDGKFLTMFNYQKYRKIFMKKYADMLGKTYDEILSL